MSGTGRRTSARLAGVGVAGALVLALALAGRRSTATTVTYPPLDVLKPVADGLWVVDSGPIHASGMALPVRMTVIALGDGDLLLHSPIRFTPALAEKLAGVGRVRHLVAPNIAHWTFLADWQRAFPDALTWAAPGLRERPVVRRSSVRIDADLGAASPPDWAGEVAQGIVPGAAGFHEVWFLHQRSRTLILTDLIESLEPAKLPPLTSLLMQATLATRGTTALHVRAVVALRGTEARQAIGAMVDLAPERVIFSHGRWFEHDGTARLRDAFAWLLDGQDAPGRGG